MEKIKSFQVDHRKFGVGMYLSRMDGDVITYDVRMCRPNGGVYLDPDAMHTIEHLFATYARSRAGEQIIYVGPMGCRTGFYLLTRGMEHAAAIALTRDALAWIASYEGEIPGNSEEECGNYRAHNLPEARREVLPLLQILEDWTPEMLDYPL